MDSNSQDVTGNSMDLEEVQPPEPPFSPEEYQDRLQRMRQRMEAEEVDMIFITSPEAMCYFHGYAARWYREASTTRWPPLAGTAIHVDHDNLIHFGHSCFMAVATGHHGSTPERPYRV